METKLTRNIQPNNKSPFSWLSKIFKGIKTGWDAVGGVFKKFWKLLCKSKKFSNFAYVKFPKFRKDISESVETVKICFLLFPHFRKLKFSEVPLAFAPSTAKIFFF